MTVAGSPQTRTGRLGSYTLGTVASDGPWLPARILDPVAVMGGARLTVRFADGTSIAGWSARYAAAADEQAIAIRRLAGPQGPIAPVESVGFGPPTAGSWVVEVTLDYPAGLGSGVYYWLLIVSP